MTSMNRVFYVVEGIVTNPEAYEGSTMSPDAGDTEWQFSDGPSGDRSESYDFADCLLSEAMDAMRERFPGCEFRFGGPDEQVETEIFPRPKS